MRKSVPFPDSQFLIDLKERGDNALEETREIIRDLTRHATDLRRDPAISMRAGRAAR